LSGESLKTYCRRSSGNSSKRYGLNLPPPRNIPVPSSKSIDFESRGETIWNGHRIVVHGETRNYFERVSEKKKIIIYGNSDLVEEFRVWANVTIAYCVDDGDGRCCGKAIKSVFEIAYEPPQSFFVVVIQPFFRGYEIFKVMTELGLVHSQDYCIFVKLPEHDIVSLRDSYLAFSRIYNEQNNKFPGFKIHGDLSKNLFNIVTLGGSTTDPTLNDIMAWPEYLYNLMKKQGVNVNILNGGFSSYTSVQEMIKLIRDIILPDTKIDIIISYSGVNDFVETKWIKKKPFVSGYHHDLFAWISQREGKDALHGRDTDKTPEDIWLTNQRVMSCICREFNIKFLGIFQATAFSEGQPSLFIDEYIRAGCEFWNNHQAYLNIFNMKSIYDKADKLIQNTPWILNFRHIFGENTDYDIYYDNAHVYERGNQVIAANIFENLLKMGYLNEVN
jgi:hypothetical protein